MFSLISRKHQSMSHIIANFTAEMQLKFEMRMSLFICQLNVGQYGAVA